MTWGQIATEEFSSYQHDKPAICISFEWAIAFRIFSANASLGQQAAQAATAISWVYRSKTYGPVRTYNETAARL